VSAPAKDVTDYLDGLSSLALDLGTNLATGEIPDGDAISDRYVGVFDSGGFDPQPNYDYERPTVQVRVRGNRGDYLGAHSLAKAIQVALNGQVDLELGSSRYLGVWAQGDVLFIGWDEAKRPIFTINFRLHRTASA